MKIRRFPRAIRDVDALWDKIAADDPDAADRMVERLAAAAGRLVDFPESGRPRPELGEGVRGIVVGRYLVLYRIGPDSVDVVRVVHGARALEGLIGGD